MNKYEALCISIVLSTAIACLTLLSIKGCEETEKTARACIEKGMTMAPNGHCMK